MTGPDPVRLLDRIVGACFGLLLAALALYGVVQIVRSIWPTLAIMAGVVGVVGLATWLVLRRRRY